MEAVRGGRGGRGGGVYGAQSVPRKTGEGKDLNGKMLFKIGLTELEEKIAEQSQMLGREWRYYRRYTVAHAVARNHVEARICAAADHEGQESFFVP